MTKILQLPLGPIQTNCYVVGDQATGRAIVIDPAFAGRTIAQTLADHELTLTDILITHAHFDHVGGLGELKMLFPEVPVHIHPDAVPMLALAPMQAQLFGVEMLYAPTPERELAEGDVIQNGGLTFDVLYTPGHAPGHVSFVLRGGEAIFSGDVLFQGSIGRTDLPGGDFDTLISVIIEKLLVLPDSTRVYSGHGPVTTIGRERIANPFLQ